MQMNPTKISKPGAHTKLLAYNKVNSKNPKMDSSVALPKISK